MSPIPEKRRGHGKTRSYYEFGATTLFASRFDQRFSYCLSTFRPSTRRRVTSAIPLAVVVHGTGRTAQRYRDELAEFAEQHGCVVLAPLCPAGIGEPGELNSYKRIKHGDIRFDDVLLHIVNEVAARYRLHSDRFLLHGFSGGGHFAHRFYYLHPHRLMGVSIGASGTVTLIDPTRPWWVGTADYAEIFNATLDVEQLRHD